MKIAPLIKAIEQYNEQKVESGKCKVESVGLAEDKYAYERVPQRVWYVGNVMIDTLLANRARFRQPEVWNTLALQEKQYIVMTMHRPANVDEENHLRAMMEQIVDNAHGLPIVFPIHPRTAKLFYNLWKPTSDSSLKGREECTVYGVGCKEGEELAKRFPNLHIVEPLGYLEFNYLVERAKAVVTDSGGITEETTVMGVPCITLRDNTERPETCTVGTNELIGTNPAAIKPALDKLFAGEWKKGGVPALWDGHTAERIIAILASLKV
jgi:UDP-N-acetylglucosamine 2-epimerase (non-hydrolysing)